MVCSTMSCHFWLYAKTDKLKNCSLDVQTLSGTSSMMCSCNEKYCMLIVTFVYLNIQYLPNSVMHINSIKECLFWHIIQFSPTCYILPDIASCYEFTICNKWFFHLTLWYWCQLNQEISFLAYHKVCHNCCIPPHVTSIGYLLTCIMPYQSFHQRFSILSLLLTLITTINCGHSTLSGLDIVQKNEVDQSDQHGYTCPHIIEVVLTVLVKV